MLKFRYYSHILIILTGLSLLIAGCGPVSLPGTGSTWLLSSDSPVGQVAGLFSAAQSAQAQTPPLEAHCLTGAWEVTDLQQVMAESFLQAQTTLDLEGVDGRTQYEFAEDGEMTIRFDALSATLNGVVDGMPMMVHQSLNGEATAVYQVDATAGELVLSGFGGDGILFALAINGQTLVEGDMPVWRAFTSGLGDGAFFQPAPLVVYSRVSAECSGDSLTLRAREPFPGPQVKLRRSR